MKPKSVPQSVPGVFHSFGQTYFKRRYTILFYTLVFTMVASPVIAAFGLSGVVIDSLLAASLVAAVMPVHSGKVRNLMLVVMIAMLLAHPVTAWLGYPTLSEMTRAAWTLIGLLAAAAALRFAMRGAEVNAEHVFAALSAYLLAGIYFGNLYWALEQIHPGTLITTSFSRPTAIYFSFVTLATIGYGDIVPRTEVARSLAVIEGVGGQLFLAVFVARLLTLYKSAAD